MNCCNCRAEVFNVSYEDSRLIFCSKSCKKHFFEKYKSSNRYDELAEDNTVLSLHRRINFDIVNDNNITEEYKPDYVIKYMDGTTVVEDVHIPNYNLLPMIKKMCNDLGYVYRCLNDRTRKPLEYITSSYKNDYGVWNRPTFEYIFMNMAEQFAARSTCVRSQVGAVFVDKDYQRVLAIGYNGGLKGDKNQCESLLPGKCGCIHAEQNAMMKALEPLNNSVLFVTMSPCIDCAKSLIVRGVSKVVYNIKYRDDSGLKLLEKNGVIVLSWEDFVEQNI